MIQSAIEFHTKGQIARDIEGSKETKVTARTQEASIDNLHGDPKKKIGKIEHVQILTSAHMSALAIHEAIPGADIAIAASPRVPFHLIRSWIKQGKRQIWIEGFSAPEIAEITRRLMDAGFPGAVRAKNAIFAQEQVDEATVETADMDDPEIIDKSTIVRNSAWSILLAMGADAVKEHLRSAEVLVKPKNMHIAPDATDPSQPRKSDARKMLEMPKKTGKARTDRDLYFHSLESATAHLNEALASGEGVHINGVVAATGLGKTHAAIALMLLSDRPYAIAAPTTELAQQIYDDLIAAQARGIGRDKKIRLHKPRNEECSPRPRG